MGVRRWELIFALTVRVSGINGENDIKTISVLFFLILHLMNAI
jgi:hypothetical protein